MEPVVPDSGLSEWLGWCWAEAMGAALGVEGRTQCGLALKARLDSVLNQVFVFGIGLYVVQRGPGAQSCHSSTELPQNFALQ